MKFPDWLENELILEGYSLEEFGHVLNQAVGLKFRKAPTKQTIGNWKKLYKKMTYPYRAAIAAYRRQKDKLGWTVEYIDIWFETDIEPTPPKGREDGRSLPDLISELKEIADTATKQEASEVLVDLGSVLYQLIRVAIEEPIKPVPSNELLAYVNDLFKKHGQVLTEETISAAKLRMNPEDYNAVLDLLSSGSTARADAIAPIRRLIKKMLKIDIDQQSLLNLLELEKSGASEDLA